MTKRYISYYIFILVPFSILSTVQRSTISRRVITESSNGMNAGRQTLMIVEQSLLWYFLKSKVCVYRVTHLLAEMVMLTSVPSKDNIGVGRN